MRPFIYPIWVACLVGGVVTIGCGDAGTTGASGNPTTSSSSGTAGAGGESGKGGASGSGGAPCKVDQMQPCFTGNPTTLGIGVCVAGTQTCIDGVFGPCTGELTATAEKCNGLDDDCNGKMDEGCQCQDGQTQSCYSGPSGTQNIGSCKEGIQTCIDGSWGTCIGEATPSVEMCDAFDNDCNGQVDEGNPGGGASCGPSVGNCITQTDCVNGVLVCRGTFVGPAGVGAPGNPGTQAQPLSTIAAAQANAALIGGGADVCVCDTAAVGASIYNENVKMIEGVSVLGSYDCADWSRAIGTYVTTIQNTTATGVLFAAGITAITTLDGMTVVGLAGTGSTQAITVNNSSPSLLNVTAIGGETTTSYGLLVVGAISGAAPTVTGGTYSALATGVNSRQVAVSLNQASGTFTNVTMTGSPASPSGAATTSVALWCADCPGTTITGGSINGAEAASTVAGIWASGNVAGVSVTNTNISGGRITQEFGTTYGVGLYNCTGMPTFTAVNILGSTNDDAQHVDFGMQSDGAMCAPIISGGTVVGCESGNYCVGMSCSTGSLCTATNATIRGASGTAVLSSLGVRCGTNGCGKFSGNTITVGTLAANATMGMGIDIVGANPAFDDNDISGPMCPNGVGSNPQLYAAHFSNTSAVVTNNVLHDQPCNAQVDVVRFDKVASNGSVLGPMIHNNTIQFTTCNGCPVKHGLVIAAPPGAITAAAGIVRNNIFRNAGIGNFANGIAVRENDTSSDLSFFENNDLWAPNGGMLFIDEGAAPLQLVAINALLGSTGNINADPQLDATYHIPMTSPCRNAGTATGAPAFDFDGQARPQEMSYDIGADEYMP